MGIDASIYSQMQAPDIMGSIAKGLTMRDMMDQRALQKKELAEQEGIKQAYGAGMIQGEDGKMQFDQQKTMGQLAQINPQKAFEFQEEMEKVGFEKQKMQREKQLEQLDLTSRLLGPVEDQPTYDQALAMGQKMGLDMSGIPRTYDPGYVRTVRLQTMSAKEQLEHQMKEQGHGLKVQGMEQDDERFNRTHGLRERELGLKKEQMQMKGQNMASGMKPPPGYRFLPDGSLEPIPGGPAARGIEKEEQAKISKQSTAQARGQTVLREVTRSLEALNSPQGLFSPPASGPIAGQLKDFPLFGAMAPSFQLEQHLTSLKSNVSIDQLQAMREASPTGGALGQVPVQQQVFLMSVLGSLHSQLPPEVLKENLEQINNIYLDVMFGSEQELERGLAEGKLNPEDVQAINGARMKTAFDLFGRRQGPDRSQSNFRPQSRGSRPQQRQTSPMPAQPTQVSPEMRRGALEELARRRQMAGQTPRGE